MKNTCRSGFKLRSILAVAFVPGILLALMVSCSGSPDANSASVPQVRLISEYNPSAAGDAVTFFFSIAKSGVAATPTGSVTFKDGSNVLGKVDIDPNGLAIFTTQSLAGGNHMISASYSGDSLFPAADSASVLQTVSFVVNGVTVTPVATTTAAAAPPPGEPSEPEVVD